MATPAPVRPPSITTYDAEVRALGFDPSAELDLEYVDAVAADLAAILAAGRVAEAAYQPGDGTCYRLVIVPLAALKAAQPRVKDGQVWQRHAVAGMKRRDGGDDGADGDGFYEPTGYLVCQVENSCYPIRLEGRGPDSGLAAGYLAEKWNLGFPSAVAVAVLLRAVCYHLDFIRA